MTAQRSSPGLLPAHGIQQLLAHKRRIQQDAVGHIPEPLVQATVQVVARLTQGQVLRSNSLRLARQALKELARKRRQPDTLLLVLKRPEGHWSAEHGARR